MGCLGRAEPPRRLAAAEAPWGWRWGKGWRWGRRLWGLSTKGARREGPGLLAEVGVGGLLALRLLLYSLECVGVPSAGHPCPLGPAWPGTF